MLLAFMACPYAGAHEIQPAYLELRQTAPDTFSVFWKVPARADLRDGMHPLFPANAKITSEPVRYQTVDAYIERYTITCPGGLVGRPLSITGPAAAVADVLVRVEFADGSVQILRLSPANPSLIIPAAANRLQTVVTFLLAGIKHILTGIDHLLFVFGLLMISPKRWTLVKTITGFTVAHSITLAIATLGYASLPLPPLYACIALSILFLGPEILRFQRGETSFTLRHPWVVAFVFGLLHGFGFASGLTALGLPHAEIPMALLFFNLGVEIGQLSFVGLIILLERSFRILEIRWPRWTKYAPAYVVGGLGAYWTISLTWVMLAGLG